MLYELHNQGQDKFVYTCNSCIAHVETRYQCTVCDDFDLCVPCYDKEGHRHKMENLGLDLDVGSLSGDMFIQRCIQSLVLAWHCHDANCRLLSCQKMKRVIRHSMFCNSNITNICPFCMQLIGLYWYHAKHCQETKCSVPFCSFSKSKLQQMQHLMQKALRQNARNQRAGRGVPVGNVGVGNVGVGGVGNVNVGLGGVQQRQPQLLQHMMQLQERQRLQQMLPRQSQLRHKKRNTGNC